MDVNQFLELHPSTTSIDVLFLLAGVGENFSDKSEEERNALSKEYELLYDAVRKREKSNPDVLR